MKSQPRPAEPETRKTLGINGLGRIGKLTLWHHIERRYFSEIVVNIGREVGRGLQDIAEYVERDSTFGWLHNYLYGARARSVIESIDEEKGTMLIDGTPVKFLRESRNPKDIPWLEEGVELVMEATGQFLDPTVDADAPEGSARGHLAAGARKVICSAPFKIKDKSKSMPSDAVTCVTGINEEDFDPERHAIVSHASCTTTCLAHMVKPLLQYFGATRMLSASMATVHAATGTQPVLDRLPGAGTDDLRKNRSVMNNIILTTTGAAKALALVLPEMKTIGFIAESVRIPVSTGSLIILVVNLSNPVDEEPVGREILNNIYRDAAQRDGRGYLVYTDEQNVSSDIVGLFGAAAVIEGHETHTRTANISIDLTKVMGIPKDVLDNLPSTLVEKPVTQAVIYGWYDNELGSYVNMAGEWTCRVASMI